MTDNLYSVVNRRIQKHRQIHSALIIREPHLQYIHGFEGCCEEHAYAVVVPMSTHIVNGNVFGHVIGGATVDGKPHRMTFSMPLVEFLELDLIDVKRAGRG